ncbi:MAG: hypothetical protein K2M34_03140 [Alphaproteobacteria bacterium]|nr:hypothetical protein [Alphaproteobacteria bacterium]
MAKHATIACVKKKLTDTHGDTNPANDTAVIPSFNSSTPQTPQCTTNSDCGSEQICDNGVCKNKPATNPPATQNAGNTCFTKNTSGAKRYIPPVNTTGRRYFWIGDSRMQGMARDEIVGNKPNEGVIAQGSMGHSWFQDTAIPMLNNCLHDGDVVILAMGANDIGSTNESATRGANNYIATYGDLIRNHPNITFRILSVNPVQEQLAKQSGYKLTNTLITKFNNTLQSALNQYWIDTYTPTLPMITALTAGDGLHYAGGKKSNKIENKIYDTVMSSIGG